MKNRPRSFWTLIPGLLMACLAVGDLTACSRGSGGGGGEQPGSSTLTVLAASSLKDAFGELESMFEEQYQGTKVTTSFAGSSKLLTQIQQGAGPTSSLQQTRQR